MTQPRVERQRANVWPWVVGLLVLALLIWTLSALFAGDRRDLRQLQSPPGPQPAMDGERNRPPPAAIARRTAPAVDHIAQSAV